MAVSSVAMREEIEQFLSTAYLSLSKEYFLLPLQ